MYHAGNGAVMNSESMPNSGVKNWWRYKELDRKTTREVMANWRDWARDFPPDSAEINYYTISPAFRGTKWAKPTPSTRKYKDTEAEMVEDVLREMYKWQPKAREWLRVYWLQLPNNRLLGQVLGVHRETVRKNVAYAHDVFAKHWGLLFMRIDR